MVLHPIFFSTLHKLCPFHPNIPHCTPILPQTQVVSQFGRIREEGEVVVENEAVEKQ